jgi:hypothetical protein
MAGAAQHSSPGLRSAGGLGGLNPHADSVDAFQYQQDHYSGKHMQQRSGKEAMYGGRDQSSDDDNRYPAAEPIGKSHYGVHGRRQGGAMAGQYGNFQGGAKRADEEMDIEPMLGGGNQLNQQEPMAAMKGQK